MACLLLREKRWLIFPFLVWVFEGMCKLVVEIWHSFLPRSPPFSINDFLKASNRHHHPRSHNSPSNPPFATTNSIPIAIKPFSSWNLSASYRHFQSMRSTPTTICIKNNVSLLSLATLSSPAFSCFILSIPKPPFKKINYLIS